jgi:hypothetical protein
MREDRSPLEREAVFLTLIRSNILMEFVPQEVQIMTSRWQKKADKTFMNAMPQNTVPRSNI